MEMYYFSGRTNSRQLKKDINARQRTGYLLLLTVLLVHGSYVINRSPLYWHDWQMSRLGQGDSSHKVVATLGKPDWVAKMPDGETVFTYYGDVIYADSPDHRVRWSVIVDPSDRVVKKTRGRIPTRC